MNSQESGSMRTYKVELRKNDKPEKMKNNRIKTAHEACKDLKNLKATPQNIQQKIACIGLMSLKQNQKQKQKQK